MPKRKIKNAEIDCLLKNFRQVIDNESFDFSYDEQLTERILARASVLQKLAQEPEASLEKILSGVARENQTVAQQSSQASELEQLLPEKLLVTRADLLRVSKSREIEKDDYSLSDAIYEVAISWIQYSVPSAGVVAYVGWFVGFVPKISLVDLLQNGLIL